MSKTIMLEGNIKLLEDGTGQHAIKVKMIVNGTYSEYVLIYDKKNRRIKALYIQVVRMS